MRYALRMYRSLDAFDSWSPVAFSKSPFLLCLLKLNLFSSNTYSVLCFFSVVVEPYFSIFLNFGRNGRRRNVNTRARRARES